MTFQPTASYQEDPRIAAIDEAMQIILLKMRTMSRAASKDRPRYRQELRGLLQDVVSGVMKFADTLDH